jgi:hypothetical protein
VGFVQMPQWPKTVEILTNVPGPPKTTILTAYDFRTGLELSMCLFSLTFTNHCPHLSPGFPKGVMRWFHVLLVLLNHAK